jgi:hypothetical protein
MVAGLITVLLITHLPALLPRSTIQDEAVYVVVARQLLRGGRLYIDVVDRKPPLLFWVYEEILRLFGTHDWLALHGVGVLWVLATMGALYAVGSRLGGSAAGMVAALLYPIFQTFWRVTNLALNGEVLMNLPEVLGFAIAYRRARGLELKHGLVHAIWLCVGFATVLLAAALVLRGEGDLREAVYWSILDHDVSYGPLSAVFWERGARTTLIFIGCCAPLLLGTMWSLAHRQLWVDREPERVALVTFLAVTIVGTAASGRFFDYYYLQLLPPLCLLAAPWFASVWVRQAGTARAMGTQAAIGACAVVFLIINLLEDPAPLGQTAIALYVRAHAEPQDRFFVWGQSTKLYLQADLQPATRYIAFFPLTGYIFGSPWNQDPSHEDTQARILPGAWANLAQDFARHPPRYILDTEGVRFRPKYPIANFPFLRDLIRQHYRLVFTAPEGFLYESRPVVPSGSAPVRPAAPVHRGRVGRGIVSLADAMTTFPST